jgi:hypothetical protein
MANEQLLEEPRRSPEPLNKPNRRADWDDPDPEVQEEENRAWQRHRERQRRPGVGAPLLLPAPDTSDPCVGAFIGAFVEADS